MKQLTFAAALLAATTFAPTAFAQDSDVSVATGFDFVSQYVFRGASLADDAIQPYAEVSVGNFTVGGWFSTAIGDDSAVAGDEFDLYAGYSVPLEGSISLDLGATYYHYPQGGDFFGTDNGGTGSYEVSASVGFGDVPLEPSVSVYYDLTLEAFTLEGGVGHSVPVGDAQSFDLGLTVGLVDGDGFSYEWATASAALSHAFTDDVSVYAGANFALNSEDVLDFNGIINGEPEGSLFWLGTGISAGF
ncbi:TorF family putative porin [Litorimonas sp. WD9-15]|uniref:TorF family putative porin n=1 Tax=Litorimonas sp. WD9-15 TaxID=3418716 RepID=UPI003D05622B